MNDNRTDRERRNGMSYKGLADFGIIIKVSDFDGKFYAYHMREPMHTEGEKSKLKVLEKLNSEFAEGSWAWIFAGEMSLESN